MSVRANFWELYPSGFWIYPRMKTLQPLEPLTKTVSCGILLSGSMRRSNVAIMHFCLFSFLWGSDSPSHSCYSQGCPGISPTSQSLFGNTRFGTISTVGQNFTFKVPFRRKYFLCSSRLMKISPIFYFKCLKSCSQRTGSSRRHHSHSWISPVFFTVV